jgi:hypothetical protein
MNHRFILPMQRCKVCYCLYSLILSIYIIHSPLAGRISSQVVWTGFPLDRREASQRASVRTWVRVVSENSGSSERREGVGTVAPNMPALVLRFGLLLVLGTSAFYFAAELSSQDAG